MFQPPQGVTINDVWVAGLMLAFLVWSEAIVIVFLSVKLHTLKTNKRGNNASNNRDNARNLPKK
jgi:hypothetical protein